MFRFQLVGKGLLNAVQYLFPDIEHRMCTRHIYANWRKKYRDQAYQKPFWQCAKASCVPFFNYCKAKLAKLTPDGAKDMMNTSPKHWSRAWFNLGSYCDSVDNNMCESFNNWIVDFRAYPILSMLEGIRTKTFVRIQQNRCKSNNWPGRVCPNILKKLNKHIDQAGNCTAIWNGKDGFEVEDLDKKRYRLDLDALTCSCRYWQLAGIPCAHAISAIVVSSKNPEDYIVNYYSIEAYNKIYDHCMMPMEGMDQWPPTDHPNPMPPGYVKMPGRPRKERREPGEAKKGTKASRVGLASKCRRCRKPGHNTRTCSANPKGDNLIRTFRRAKEVLDTNVTKKRGRNDGTTNSTNNVQKESRPQKKARKSGVDSSEMPSQSSVNAPPVKMKKAAGTKKAAAAAKK